MFKKTKQRLKMWDYYIANYLERTTMGYKETRPNSVSLGYNRLDYNDANSVFFVVESYSENVLFGFISQFKEFIEDREESIVLNAITKFGAYDIDWNSPRMQSRLRTWQNRQEDNDSRAYSAFTLKDTYGSNEVDAWLRKSIEYLYLSEQEKDNVTLAVTVFIQLINHDISKEGLSAFKTIITSLMRRASQDGVFLKQISTDLFSFLTTELPLSHVDVRENRYSKFIVNNEILAKNYRVRQGDIGDKGIYIATDIYSQRAIFKVFKEKDVSPEILAVVGDTGSGKSLLMKTLICQLLAYQHYGLIDDVEGDEYSQLVDWVARGNSEDAISINMRNGGFVDPIPIPDLVGDASVDESLKGQSITYTRLMLNILIGEQILQTSEWMDILLSSLISALYEGIGVTEDKSTWAKSKNYSIKDISRLLKQCIDSRRVLPALEKLIPDEEFFRCATLVYAKLQRFFAHDGSESYLFSEPINIDEINGARLVQLQYNMRSTASNIVDPVQMELMLLNSSIVSFQRSLFCKYKLKKFNFKVKEEIQRWSKFPNADTILNVEVTGGRKMGDIILLATNNPGAMINSGNEILEGIFSNCTSYIIGAIQNAKVRKDLLDRISASHLETSLNEISRSTLTVSSQKSGRKRLNPYEYGFVVCLDRGSTSVGKVLLPDDILNSELFKTGVTAERIE